MELPSDSENDDVTYVGEKPSPHQEVVAWWKKQLQPYKDTKELKKRVMEAKKNRQPAKFKNSKKKEPAMTISVAHSWQSTSSEGQLTRNDTRIHISVEENRTTQITTVAGEDANTTVVVRGKDEMSSDEEEDGKLQQRKNNKRVAERSVLGGKYKRRV